MAGAEAEAVVPVPVLCVTVVSCTDLAPARSPGHARYVRVEVSADTAQQTPPLGGGAAPVLNRGEGHHMLFRVGTLQRPSRVRLLLMDDLDCRAGTSGGGGSGGGICGDSTESEGFVGAAEIRFMNARMDGRWKLEQHVQLATQGARRRHRRPGAASDVDSGSSVAGSCHVILRWDPGTATQPPLDVRALVDGVAEDCSSGDAVSAKSLRRLAAACRGGRVSPESLALNTLAKGRPWVAEVVSSVLEKSVVPQAAEAALVVLGTLATYHSAHQAVQRLFEGSRAVPIAVSLITTAAAAAAPSASTLSG
jgi:hypothetical protein